MVGQANSYVAVARATAARRKGPPHTHPHGVVHQQTGVCGWAGVCIYIHTHTSPIPSHGIGRCCLCPPHGPGLSVACLAAANMPRQDLSFALAGARYARARPHALASESAHTPVMLIALRSCDGPHPLAGVSTHPGVPPKWSPRMAVHPCSSPCPPAGRTFVCELARGAAPMPCLSLTSRAQC